MCQSAERHAKSIDEFLERIAQKASKKQHLKKIRVTLKQKNEQKNTLE
jgi:hypothetical protein